MLANSVSENHIGRSNGFAEVLCVRGTWAREVGRTALNEVQVECTSRFLPSTGDVPIGANKQVPKTIEVSSCTKRVEVRKNLTGMILTGHGIDDRDGVGRRQLFQHTEIGMTDHERVRPKRQVLRNVAEAFRLVESFAREHDRLQAHQGCAALEGHTCS